jgi:hypothetical protein
LCELALNAGFGVSLQKVEENVKENREVKSGKTYITNDQNKRWMLNICYIKGEKAIPIRGRGGPQACETSRLPHFLDNRLTDGGEIVSLTRRPPFTAGRFLVLISVRG